MEGMNHVAGMSGRHHKLSPGPSWAKGALAPYQDATEPCRAAGQRLRNRIPGQQRARREFYLHSDLMKDGHQDKKIIQLCLPIIFRCYCTSGNKETLIEECVEADDVEHREIDRIHRKSRVLADASQQFDEDNIAVRGLVWREPKRVGYKQHRHTQGLGQTTLKSDPA